MSKPHKWHKEIKAWADGAEIEWILSDIPHEWITCNNQPSWGNDNIKFRIKPQPKEPQYLYAYFNTTNSKIELDCVECDLGFLVYLGKIPLITEVDDDN